MIIKNINKAIFLKRLNRFVWKWLLNWKEILFHIWDTGRLWELLKENNKILIEKLTNTPKRKYSLRLISALNPNWNFVLVNSLLHSKLVEEYLKANKIPYQKEVKIWNSRIDFLLNKNIFVEIKWCSLIIWDTGLFPDAPTKRWTKHLEELIKILKNWGKAEIRFLAVDNIKYFSPNKETDPQFSKSFYNFLNNWGKVNFLKVNLSFLDNSTLNVNLEKLKNIKIL